VGVTGFRTYDSTSAGIPRNTGANQTWNFFSLMMTTAPAQTHTYVLPSSTPSNIATQFTAATLADADGGDYTYYKSSANLFELIGTGDGTTTTSFSDPIAVMKWPVSYNTSYTDNFAATMTGGATGTWNGSSTTTATGHGNLTMPSGLVLNDVLQVMSIANMTMTVATPSPMSTTFKNVTYEYYHTTQRYPVLTIDYSWVNGANPAFSAEVNYLLATGISDFTFDAGYAIYPNPAKDNFNVTLTNTGSDKASLEIFNTMGQVVKTVDLGSGSAIQTSVSITDLPAGVYTVKTTLGEKNSVRKMIID
jgi:hypothetical protein